ncbi:syntaxin 18 [Pelomyxa schiedti]|nr:syntaxin 18 [Pelomyxa schiedti]
MDVTSVFVGHVDRITRANAATAGPPGVPIMPASTGGVASALWRRALAVVAPTDAKGAGGALGSSTTKSVGAGETDYGGYKQPRRCAPFLNSCSIVMNEIEELRRFITKHNGELLNTVFHTNSLTEEEKANLEEQINVMLQQCCCHVDSLKALLGDPSDVKDEDASVYAHMHGIVSYLYTRLQSVTDLFTKVKALRLESSKHQRWYEFHLRNSSSPVSLEPTVRPPKSVAPQSQTQPHTSIQKPPPLQPVQTQQEQPPLQLEAERKAMEAAEAEELEQENELLYRKLDSSLEQIKDVETQILEISRMHQILETKAVEQAADIDTLFEHVTQATANVKKGNEEVRKATETRSCLDLQSMTTGLVIILALLLLMLHYITP